MTDQINGSRQWVACKFRAGDARSYTYHNDGEPVAIGDKVIVEAPREEGKITIEVVEIVDKPTFPTKPIIGKAPPPTPCGCHRCTAERVAADPAIQAANQADPINANPLVQMFLCETCGNKRCPHAADHRLDCTNSNEPGQKGSLYEDALLPPSA